MHHKSARKIINSQWNTTCEQTLRLCYFSSHFTSKTGHITEENGAISPHPSVIRLSFSAACSHCGFRSDCSYKWDVIANYRSSWGPVLPQWLGSPIQVGPSVIGADVVFVSGAAVKVASQADTFLPPSPPDYRSYHFEQRTKYLIPLHSKGCSQSIISYPSHVLLKSSRLFKNRQTWQTLREREKYT